MSRGLPGIRWAREPEIIIIPVTMFRDGIEEQKMSVEDALEEASETLRAHGHSCAVSVRDFEDWFRADTPYPDLTIEEVIVNPLLVIHEVVEIDQVKKLGLRIDRRVILDNLELVDKAHFLAAQVEIEIAIARRDVHHLAERLEDIRSWSKDPLTGPQMRLRYSGLADDVADALARLEKE